MIDYLIFSQYPNAYAPKRLAEEATKLGMSSKVLWYGNTDINCLPDAKYIILREPNARDCMYDLKDKILNYYIDKTRVVLNAKSYLKWSVLDKLVQHVEFGKADIPHVKLLGFKQAKYPYIVKDKLGSHGSHVFKIENKNDLKAVFSKGYAKEDLLVQEFQASGFDLRVIVLKNKVLGIMQRTPKKGEFLSNYSQGGEVIKYNGGDVETISKIALEAAKCFALDYVGVDLMKGNDGEWKVLEVNRACQFKGFEMATHVNIAKEIITSFLRLT